jgi:hypothetical protein
MRNIKIIIPLIILFTISCKKEKNRICEIYSEEMGYEIGRIESYITGLGRVTYRYTYTVNGNSYKGKEKHYGIGQTNETLVGKDFLVVYKLNSPGESDLNVSYSVGSQMELEQKKMEFENNPPKPDWPKCD